MGQPTAVGRGLTKRSRAIAVVLLVIQAASIGLFLLWGLTTLTILMTVSPSGGGQIPVVVDKAGQTATLTFTSSPRNGGLLPADVSVGFGVSLADGSYDNRNSTSVYLPPGGSGEVSLSLKVPVSVLNIYADAKGHLGIYTNVRTLWGLATLEYDALTEGG